MCGMQWVDVCNLPVGRCLSSNRLKGKSRAGVLQW